jgi:hypothetical protein
VTRRRLAFAAVAVGLVGSQAGHLLAFQLRFGSAALQLQSSGAHAYFPTVAKTALGAVAAALIAGIFVIGLARVLAGGSRASRGSAPKYIELLSALFTIQLLAFIVQEVGEAVLAGVAADSATHLLLWGTLAQLPVAVAGAAALRWLWTRVGSAVRDLRAALSVAQARQPPFELAFALGHVPDGALLVTRILRGSLRKRGPPSSFASARS